MHFITRTSTVFALLVLLGGIALYSSTRETGPQEKAPQHELIMSPEQAQKEFYSQELGIAFSYPAEWGDVQYRVGRGGSGSAVSGIIRAPACTLENECWATLEFGGSTRNFEQPRSAGIAETDGYIKRDGRYYRLLAGQEHLVDYKVEELQARNILGIIIYGDARQVDPSTIEADVRQSIFNLPSSDYAAITFAYSNKQVSDEKMRGVLESVELR